MMLGRGDGTRHAFTTPAPCPIPPTIRGWWRDGTGEWHYVQACEGHAHDLTCPHPRKSPVDMQPAKFLDSQRDAPSILPHDALLECVPRPGVVSSPDTL